MPVPAKKRVKHYRGDDFRYPFRLDQYVDPDDPSAGTTPVDLSGWTSEVEANPDQANGDPIGITASDPDATGVITIDMPAESTTDPDVDVIEFDVALITPAPESFRRTYLHVTVTLVEQVP